MQLIIFSDGALKKEISPTLLAFVGIYLIIISE